MKDFIERIKAIKRIHFLLIALLVVVNIIYFLPQFQGQKVNAHDAVSSTAWSKQVIDFEKDGETVNWNPSIFSGMPWGLLTVGEKYNVLGFLNDVSHVFFSYPAGYFIKASILTYIALVLLEVPAVMSFFLALLFTFNVNALALLAAGHGNKIEVVMGLPILFAGVLLAYKGKVLQGFLITAVSVSIAILRVHPQMFYYLLMILVVFGLVYLIFAIINGQWKSFFKITAVVILAFVLGGLSNISQLISSKDFAKDTMRGVPILQEEATAVKTKEGLDWDYAMRWSAEAKDFWSIIIPRALGGSSLEDIGKRNDTPLGQLLANNQKADKLGHYYYPLYFGNIDSSGGPFYMSVILVFIFIFSFFTMDLKNKIAFGLSFIFLLMVAMGKNSFINTYIFEYLPYYNKWRAPSSIMSVFPAILVIASGIGIKTIVDTKDKKQLIKPLIYTTVGFVILILAYWMYASNSFSFVQSFEQDYQFAVQDAIINTRKMLLKSDVLRSIFLIALSAILLYFFIKEKLSKKYFVIIIGVLMVLDLLQIDYRYFNKSKWESENKYLSTFTPRNVDLQILNNEKKGRGYYRVFDQNNPFNDAIPSYLHNMVGGYRPDKLRRYQDVIENHLAKGNIQVFNMLNTKYFISQKQELSVNNQANGNAWFIKEIETVNTPNEEIKALDDLNTKEQAVVLATEFDAKDYDKVGNGTGNIELTSYHPNKMKYATTNNPSDQFAVFSEVWYGRNNMWRAYVDGKETPIVRVNYILRGIEVPANAKEIVFELKAEARYSWVSIASSLLIAIFLILGILFGNKLEEKLNFISK